MKKINIAAPRINNFSLFCDRAKEVFESGILTNNGKYLKQLENSIFNYLNADCTSVCNATLGLEITLKSLGLEGNVIVPSFTFCATVHAIVLAGLTPNFVDIDPSTFNIDPIKVKEAINDQTSAIIGVHVFGNPCNIIALEKIAKDHNLKLIFDAAHAFGSTYHQKMIGIFGDAEVFSMHATKTLISGEGGIISSKNKDIINYISTAKNFGIISENDTAFVGTNAKMSELHALVGLDSFSEIDNNIKKKNIIIDSYKILLKDVKGISFQKIEDNSTCAYFYFSIIIDEKKYGINRDKLAEILLNNGIQARKYFYLPIHKQSAYKQYNSLILPNSEKISSNILCLPTHTQLTSEDISYICEIIKNAGSCNHNHKLIVKAGVKQLHLFENQHFSYYEAYLRGDETSDDFKKLVSANIKLFSIHMPSSITYNNQAISVDFCKEGVIGQASFEKLKQLMFFSNKNDVKYIVIHLGFYNSITENRYNILDSVAKKLNELNLEKVKDCENVKLCIENVPNWGTLSFEHEPIISDEKHLLYFKERCPAIGAVFDVDHLAINSVFNAFYPKFKKRYLSTKSAKLMEQEIYEATNKNPSIFTTIIEKNIKSFLSKIKPDLIHAVGSDFCNYKSIDKLPLIGEALPLQFKGIIKNQLVKDRLDHRQWLSLVADDTPIVIELHLREEYDYLTEIKNSWSFLNNF